MTQAGQPLAKSLDIFDKLVAEKAVMLSLWREIGEFCYPNQSDFGRYYTSQSNQPNRKRLIFDPTGEQSLDIFASSMVGLLANPAAKWLAFETDDQNLLDNKDVQTFLDDAQRKVLSVFNNPRTKFYDNLQSAMKMIGAFGAGMLLIDADKDSVVKFRAESPRNFDYTEDFGGNVKDVFLERVFTVSALKEKTEWVLPQAVTEKQDTDKLTVIRHIEPNPNFDPSKLGKKFAKFHSHYYLKDTKYLLHSGFFNSNRAAIGRWDRVDGSKWPDSCARVALANVKLMQNADRSMIVAMEKELRPTLFVSSEAKFGRLDTSAGAVNVGRGNPNDSIRELKTTGNQLGNAFQWMEVKRQQIRQSFFVDVFQTVESLAMTATEANIRNQEKLRIVTPKAAKIQSDLLGVAAETVLFELINNKKLTVPRALLAGGGEIKVTYISPIAQAQRFGDAQNMLQFMNDLAMIAQAFPEALDKVDPDAMVDEMAEIRGVPETILRPKKSANDSVGYEEIREGRAQAAQAQQQLQLLQQAGDAGQSIQGALGGQGA